MAKLITQTPDRTILRAFYVQYTAVLLIVLSSMIGALVNRANSKTTTETQPIEVPKVVSNALRGPIANQSIALSQIFSGNDIKEDAALSSTTEILENHDVSVELYLNVADEVNSDAALETEQALSRGQALEEFFWSKGIPKSAVKAIVGYDGSAKENLKILYLDTGGGHE